MTTPYDLLSGNRIVVRGFNGALATSFEHVNPTSLAFQYFSTATALKVASGSANDAAAGTGLQTLRVLGCTATGAIATEDFAMNGTTAVAGAVLFRHVYGAWGLTYGSGGTNAGIIYVADDGATFTSGNPATPEEILIIPAGENSAQAAVFMAPPSTGYKAKQLVLGKTTQPVVIGIWVYGSGETVPTLLYKIPTGNAGTDTIDLSSFPFGLAAGETVRIDALSTTAAGQVSVDLVMEKIYP